MKRHIDCLFIGHNEVPFEAYEKQVRLMGEDSGAYRDLSKSVLYINSQAHSITDVINLVSKEEIERLNVKPFNMLETQSNTIGYLGTFLQRRGKTFEYVNSFQDEKGKLKDILTNCDVKSVGIITTLYVSVFPVLEIMEFIKKYNTSAKVIVGGPYVSTQVRTQDKSDCEYMFKTIGADVYVNSSQGEATLVKLIDAINNNTGFAKIKNIHYKEGDNYIITPLEIEDNKLHENTVKWEVFSDREFEHVAVRTAISCPYKCSFCGFPQHAGAYQTTEIEPIIQELDLLAAMPSVKSVHFVDDTFNIPKERFKELLRKMIDRKYKFKWHSYYRCQFSDDETLELMKESGCEGVFLGIESGSNVILKNMDKAATSEQYRSGIGYLKKYGITTFGCFIIGFPGETRETINETIDFIETTGLDFYRIQQWYLEPITPIWNQKEKYGIKGQSFEWEHDTMDSATACDIVDEIFLTVKNSIYLPQYNFDFDNFLHLLHRGKNVAQLKEFLKAFNMGIRDRIHNPGRKEANSTVVNELYRSWNGTSDEKVLSYQEDVSALFNF
ncbi:PhpK family radical SAM P-methyltransferase [Mucilaginibacter sp. RCC_168]|uniref:PhpK family radical SAM P-methyltransferase n=1 Tax=Mucilaginibacter sp. RCC_168 TaxID=3239221 RepID=UPI00352416FD